MLPSVEGVPPYKAWSWASHNQLCLETGKRMFYTGACGKSSDGFEQRRRHAGMHTPLAPV